MENRDYPSASWGQAEWIEFFKRFIPHEWKKYAPVAEAIRDSWDEDILPVFASRPLTTEGHFALRQILTFCSGDMQCGQGTQDLCNKVAAFLVQSNPPTSIPTPAKTLLFQALNPYGDGRNEVFFQEASVAWYKYWLMGNEFFKVNEKDIRTPPARRKVYNRFCLGWSRLVKNIGKPGYNRVN